MRRSASLAAALLAALVAGGCSIGEKSSQPQAQIGTPAKDENAAAKLGFPSTATKNTIRVGGADAGADAAGVASAVFPGTTTSTRPTVVALVDKDDWQAGVTAAVLGANPIGAPILVSDGGDLTPVSKDTLKSLRPKGSDLSKDAQVIRIGDKPARPSGFKTAVIQGKDPYARAAAIDRFFSAARGRPSRDVVVASGEEPAFAAPAAAWAARSGDSVLLARRNGVPAATRKALAEHSKPNIYLLGPPSVLSKRTEAALGKLGTVRRIQGATPVQNAIAFARYSRGSFGWGVTVPGYNFTLASATRPLDAAASAALGSNGVFAPLLLTDSAKALPGAVEAYLLSVQPGFEGDPGQAVYNRVWILGSDQDISVAQQARIDQITELVPVQPNTP